MLISIPDMTDIAYVNFIIYMAYMDYTYDMYVISAMKNTPGHIFHAGIRRN